MYIWDRIELPRMRKISISEFIFDSIFDRIFFSYSYGLKINQKADLNEYFLKNCKGSIKSIS